jgi:peroxin-1
MSSRRSASGGSPSTTAEIVLLPALKNCFVNLPASLVGLLVNSNTAVQNVVVEVAYKSPTGGDAAKGKDGKATTTQSVYFGWTGMQSKAKLAPVVGKDGIRSGTGRHEQEVAVVEVDATFARLLGLSEGSKVNISLHIDPPLAHTVNIEPLTATDWESKLRFYLARKRWVDIDADERQSLNCIPHFLR